MTIANGVADLGVGATKVAPPAAVTAAMLAGIPLENWVMILTITYTLLQMAWLIYDKAVRPILGARRAARGGARHGE